MLPGKSVRLFLNKKLLAVKLVMSCHIVAQFPVELSGRIFNISSLDQLKTAAVQWAINWIKEIPELMFAYE